MATDAYLGEHEGTDDVDAEHVQHHARPHGSQSRQVRRPSVVEEASQAVRGGYGLRNTTFKKLFILMMKSFSPTLISWTNSLKLFS